MDKPKLRINAREATANIRSGMSDEELMRYYDISAHGLESLFQKLVKAGEITEFELHNRLMRTQRSDIVEVIRLTEMLDLTRVFDSKTEAGAVPVEIPDVPDLEPGDEGPPKVRISAEEAVKDIRDGLTDEELMTKYGLSAKGLSSLFRKLVSAGEIDKSEVEARNKADDIPELAFRKKIDPVHPHPDVDEDRAVSRTTEIFGRSSRTSPWLFGIGGFVGGVLVCAAVVFGVQALTDWKGGPSREGSPASPQTVSIASIERELDRLIVILTDIARADRLDDDAARALDAKALQKCLERCKQEFTVTDAADRALQLNCRMECVAKFGHKAREVRKLRESRSEQ